MSSIFFSYLKWWMLKKQQMHGVKESAPEKTCWDENVRLKLLYDLSAFVVCCLFLLALDCAY